ncbi:MAG: ComEA family DNA-binding protein [Candidatus Ratteibacteria bacterium]|nr:ComEA family DNA-binding protein [Candidatus Ratteibacteria bacterium]
MFDLTPQERNVALFLVITLAVGSGVLFFRRGKFRENKVALVKAVPKDDRNEEVVMVHLAGAVFQPGLYRVKKGSRLGEVLQDKNLKAQADVSNINLARPVSDGERIFIPFKADATLIKTTAGQKNLGNFSSGITTDSQSQLININQADASELAKLPGIGEILARRIVEYRRQFGSFQTKDEVKKVKAIGEKRFEKIKDLISVN